MSIEEARQQADLAVLDSRVINEIKSGKVESSVSWWLSDVPYWDTVWCQIRVKDIEWHLYLDRCYDHEFVIADRRLADHALLNVAMLSKNIINTNSNTNSNPKN